MLRDLEKVSIVAAEAGELGEHDQHGDIALGLFNRQPKRIRGRKLRKEVRAKERCRCNFFDSEVAQKISCSP